jgi:hypothetical protein
MVKYKTLTIGKINNAVKRTYDFSNVITRALIYLSELLNEFPVSGFHFQTTYGAGESESSREFVADDVWL